MEFFDPHACTNNKLTLLARICTMAIRGTRTVQGACDAGIKCIYTMETITRDFSRGTKDTCTAAAWPNYGYCIWEVGIIKTCGRGSLRKNYGKKPLKLHNKWDNTEQQKTKKVIVAKSHHQFLAITPRRGYKEKACNCLLDDVIDFVPVVTTTWLSKFRNVHIENLIIKSP